MIELGAVEDQQNEIFSFFSIFFLRATHVKYNLEKTKRINRENNEHLVNRPLTSNNNDQFDKPP